MQTSVRTEERIGRHGAAADSDTIASESRIVEVAMRPGDLAIRGTSADGGGKTVKKLVAAAAADVDAIIATIASAAASQELSGAALDGVVGGDRLLPPRNVVLVLSNSVDWDATTAVVTGLDEFGREITEDLDIPDGGNTTLTGKKVFSQITQLDIPAQSGAGGTATLGTGTLLGALTSLDVAGVLMYLAARQIDGGATEEFQVGDMGVVITKGRVWLEVENDVADGDQVFVRLVAAGAEVVGSFLNSRDGTAAAPDAVPVIGARFKGDSVDRDGVKLAIADLTFPNI